MLQPLEPSITSKSRNSTDFTLVTGIFLVILLHMLLRSGTFKFSTSLPEHSEESFTVEQLLSSPLSVLSDSDSPPLMQSGLGQSVDPPAHSHIGNMAEAGENTVSPSKFYGDGKEDVDKWLRSFERLAKANQWEDRIAEVLLAVLRSGS